MSEETHLAKPGGRIVSLDGPAAVKPDDQIYIDGEYAYTVIGDWRDAGEGCIEYPIRYKDGGDGIRVVPADAWRDLRVEAARLP